MALCSTMQSNRPGSHGCRGLHVSACLYLLCPLLQDGALEAHPAMGSADIILDLVRLNPCTMAKLARRLDLV